MVDVLECRVADWTLGAIIMFDLVLVILEADAASMSGTANVPSWINFASTCFSILYCLECVVRFYVHRGRLFHDASWAFDLLIVTTGCLTSIAFLAFAVGSGTPAVPVFRIFRIAKLGRAMKLMNLVPELRIMVRGMYSSSMATIWGTLCVFIFCWYGHFGSAGNFSSESRNHEYWFRKGVAAMQKHGSQCGSHS